MRRFRMVDMCKGKNNNDFKALMMSSMSDCTLYGILKVRSQHHRILPRTSLDLLLTYRPSLYPSCLALDLSFFFFFLSLRFIFLLFLSLFFLCVHTHIHIYIFFPHIFIFSSEAFNPSFFYEYQSEL
jgi:hypothetical protein